MTVRRNPRNTLTNYLLDDELSQINAADYLSGGIDNIYHVWAVGKCYMYKFDAINLCHQNNYDTGFYKSL